MGPHPAVAEVRLSVRGCLSAWLRDRDAAAGNGRAGPGDLVLAACSGGADSLALAAALAFEAPGLGLRAGGVTVDHGLQPGSAQQARTVTAALAGLGLDPVRSVRVTVAHSGAGPEAAARAARYAALDEVARATGAAAVLLGHTRDDQAETVLLGLARGSGARSLAGMPARHGRYLRPLLGTGRATTSAACAALGLEPWQDPQNGDPAYARARIRHRLLPVLEEALGPGVTEALARTAGQLRDDADLLDAMARTETQRITSADPGLPAAELAALPAAIRSRVLRNAALSAGCPAGGLTARHVTALDALVTGWRGQRWADLPGGVRASRRYGRLVFASAVPGQPDPSGPDASGPGSGGRNASGFGASRREGAGGGC